MPLLSSREYQIIVPKYDNSQNLISVNRIEIYAKRMTEHFGGITIFPKVLGCNINKKNQSIFCSENSIFTSYRIYSKDMSEKEYSEITAGDLKFVRDLSKRITKELGKESVIITDSLKNVEFIRGKQMDSVSNPKYLESNLLRRKL